MEPHPTPSTDPMAVEPRNVNESDAERQEPGPEVLLTNDDLEQSPAKKRKGVYRHAVHLFWAAL